MPSPRILLFIVALTFVLGMMIWLVSALHKLYLQISFTTPLLANLLLLVLIALIGFLVFALGYYFKIFNYSSPSINRGNLNPKYKSNKFPQKKAEIAEATLETLRSQMEQIQDQVAKQALLAKSAAIAANFHNKNLEIVVFGTVSAGKTSLVNALVGEMVGEVAPTMGTTTLGTTHQITLEGLERTIAITDSPGILEAATTDHSHHAIAEELAIKADLLIFVVANDLRQSEMMPLQQLVAVGKRSILAFNKIDLFSDEEQGAIHSQLKNHVKHLIAPQDVVAISANPQPVTLPNGETLIPTAEINPLIKRIGQILRVEGDDLLADNILLQSEQLGKEAQAIIQRQRQHQAEQIIDRYQWIGAGVIAVTPLPVVDMLATAAVNTQMVIEIGKVYQCELNRDRGKELALSLGKTLVSLGVVKGTVEIIARALQTNFATYIAGKAIQGASAAYLTRIAGQSFITYFRQNQTWGDGGITAVVQQQFKLNTKEKFIHGFMQDTLSKVIDPLKQELGDDWDDPPSMDQW